MMEINHTVRYISATCSLVFCSFLTLPSLPTEMSPSARDCVMSKMEAYAHRSDKLKAFLSRSRSPSSDGGSLGPADSEAAETGASSDSGVETYDDGTHNSHNLSADSGAGESRMGFV